MVPHAADPRPPRNRGSPAYHPGMLLALDIGNTNVTAGLFRASDSPAGIKNANADADRANRLVCIARDIERGEIEETFKESETHA